jgi:nicotinamidase-related amidase
MVVTWERNRGKEKMRIKVSECTGLVIDMQERLFPVMFNSDQLLPRVQILVEGLKVLKIPMLVTEQYPKGLGPTLDPLVKALGRPEIIEKLSFSCCGEPGFISSLEKLGKSRVIICGIEAHVCVLQTVIDLVEKGFKPVVVADCISSRNPDDKAVALERMHSEGALITTSESLLFELTVEAGSQQFKSISRLVK